MRFYCKLYMGEIVAKKAYMIFFLFGLNYNYLLSELRISIKDNTLHINQLVYFWCLEIDVQLFFATNITNIIQ